MATLWQLQGQVGKQMDATLRTIGSDIDATDATVTFRSCSADEFRFRIEVDSSTPSSSIPELGQAVTLYRNGVVFFRGLVTDDRQRQDSVNIVASGPWWHLERITLEQSTADGAGVAQLRPSVPISGDMRSSIQGIINIAINAGAPITLGTVSTYFDAPFQQLNQMSVAQALSELVRLIPDAMMWFNYGTTNPTLNVTRRGFATTRTVAISDCSDYDVGPVLQLKLDQVTIRSATRATNGRRRWETQTAGSSTLANGVMVRSGPEMDTFLPDEPFDSFQISTTPTSGFDSGLRSYLNNTDPVLKQLIQQYGDNWFMFPGQIPWFTVTQGFGGAPIQYRDSANGAGTLYSQATIGPSFSVNGSPVFGKHIVTSADAIPDWARSENGIVVYDGYFTADVFVVIDWSTTTSQGPLFPSVLKGVEQFGTFTWFDNNNLFTPTAGGTYTKRGVYIYKADVPVKLVDSAYGGTIYRRPKFNYGSVPAGFANNLLAAQNWVPYEGRIVIPEDDVGVVQYRGCKVRVTGSRIAAHATMDALVESEELDLFNNTTTINLGAPPRVNYQTWIDKSRVTPQTNIQYLS